MLQFMQTTNCMLTVYYDWLQLWMCCSSSVRVLLTSLEAKLMLHWWCNVIFFIFYEDTYWDVLFIFCIANKIQHLGDNWVAQITKNNKLLLSKLILDMKDSDYTLTHIEALGHPRYPLAHEEDEARCFHQNPNLHENISCNFNQINVKSLIQLFLNNNHQSSFKILIISNCMFANSTDVHIILQSN